MKKFFRLVSMLAVTGLAFAYTSCTDYSEDINQLEQTVIANNDAQSKALKEAQENLQKAVDAANSEIAALKSEAASIEAALAALETKHDKDIKDVLAKHASDVAAINSAYEALKAQHNTDKAALETKINNVETAYKAAVADLKAKHDADIAALKTQMASDKDALQKAIDKVESDYKAAVSAEAKAREDAVKEINASIAALNTKLDENIKSITERFAKDEADLAAAVSSINNLTAQHKADVEKLQGQINTNAADIDALEAQVKKINEETIPAVQAQVDSLAKDAADFKTQVAATYATKEALAEVQTALGALEGRVTVVEATQVKFAKQLEDLQGDVEALQNAVKKAQETADKAVAAAAAAQADATKALGNIEALKNALGQYAVAGKLEATIEALQDADKAITAAYEAADEETNAKVDSLYAVVDAQLKALVDADEEMAADITKLYEEKFNKSDFAAAFKEAYEARFADDFDKAFGEALADAVQNGGVVDDAIKAQVIAAAAEAKAYTDEVNEKVDAAIENIKELKDAVSTLADRVQSIVVLPDYNELYQGYGSLTLYYLTKTKTDLVILDPATYKAVVEVYPAKAASKLTAENVTVKYLPAAGGTGVNNNVCKIATTKSVTDLGGGRVEIEATFAGLEREGFVAVAFDDKATNTVDGTEIATGNNVETEYYQVIPFGVELNGMYTLYNGKDELAATAYNAYQKFAWDLAGSGADVWTPFAGYSWYIKETDGVKPVYSTLADYAAANNLSVEDITPVMKNAATFKPASSAASYFEACKAGAIESLDAVKTSMVQEKVFAASNRGVGSQSVSTVTSTVKGVEVGKLTATYEIGRRVIDMIIEPVELDWTYDLAKDLSSEMTPAGAYDQDIDETQPEVIKQVPDFKERTVTFSGSYDIDKYNDPTDPNYIDFAKILSGKYTAELNGEPSVAADPQLTVDPVAILKAKIATVAVSKGYKFDIKENVYNFVHKYAYDADQTDVNVRFTLTLGAAPKNATIDFGTKTLPFKAEMMSGTIYIETLDDCKPFVEAYAKVAEGQFTDKAQFVKSFSDYNYWKVAEAEYIAGSKTVKNAGTNSAATITNGSNILVVDGAKEAASWRLFLTKYFESASDNFSFEATVKTWYGPSYTYKLKLGFEMPQYALKYIVDWVDFSGENDGVVRLAGVKNATTGIYEVASDDISKYFGVEGVEEVSADELKNLGVYYEITTKEDKAKGILNVPTVHDVAHAVKDVKSTIEECPIAWGDYTATELGLKATLKYAGIELDAKDIKLVTDDPVLEFYGSSVSVVRLPHTDYTVDTKALFQGTMILAESLVNVTKDPADPSKNTGVINADVLKEYDLTFELSDCAVTVGGNSVTLPAKFSYDKTTGVITYKADAAYQDKEVVATVRATLTHKRLGYNGLETPAHTAEATVTFKPIK